MKTLAKILGTVLMILSGVFFATALLLTPMMLSKDLSLTTAAAALLWLALFAGVFFLGRWLRRTGKSSEQPATQTQPPKAPAPPVQKAPAAQKTVDAIQSAAKAPEKTALRPKAEEADCSRVCLYRNEKANDEAYHLLREIIEEIRLELREGVSFLVVHKAEGVEYGVGKFGIEPKQEAVELPEEMRLHLTSEKAADWVSEILGPDCPVPWADPELWPKLKEWCAIVRRYAKVSVPECLYPAECPFSFLNDLAVDTLDNGSGISMWLRMKKGAGIHDVIRALADWDPRYGTVVLTDSDSVCTIPSLSMEDRLLCDRKHIWFGAVTGRDRITNLVNGLEYRIEYKEWPGSADDAATYGRWWLEALPPSPDARLFEMTRQIISDCRSLGVKEPTIERLLRDGLCPKAGNTCSQLTYDEDSGKFTVDYWEKGKPTAVIAQKDEAEFRCVFIQYYVYNITFISKNMHDPPAAVTMLQKTKYLFGSTKAYQKALKDYEDAFGPLPQPKKNWENDFNGGLHAILYDHDAKDEFFAELMSSFTALRPLEYFSDEWNFRQPSGRFVIMVNERHSVYLNGRCIYENPDFTGTPDSCYRDNVPAYRLYAESIAADPGAWSRAKTRDLSLEKAVETASALSYVLHTAIVAARVVKDYNKF